MLLGNLGFKKNLGLGLSFVVLVSLCFLAAKFSLAEVISR